MSRSVVPANNERCQLQQAYGENTRIDNASCGREDCRPSRAVRNALIYPEEFARRRCCRERSKSDITCGFRRVNYSEGEFAICD